MVKKTNKKMLNDPISFIKTKRSKKVKHKNGKLSKKLIVLYFILAIVFICAFFYFVVTVLFNVDKINVVGNTMYENNDIIKTSGIKKGDNLFDVDVKYAEDKLYSVYSYIEKADVKRNFPNGITINITEATPFAALEDSDGFTLLSTNGKVMERGLEELPNGIIVVRGMSTVNNTEDDKKKFDLLVTIMDYMNKLSMKKYNLIDLTDTLNMVLVFNNRIKVELGNELELEYKLQFADNIINEKIPDMGYYLLDASTPGKIMTKELSVSPWESLEKISSNGYADEDEE